MAFCGRPACLICRWLLATTFFYRRFSTTSSFARDVVSRPSSSSFNSFVKSLLSSLSPYILIYLSIYIVRLSVVSSFFFLPFILNMFLAGVKKAFLFFLFLSHHSPLFFFMSLSLRVSLPLRFLQHASASLSSAGV